MSADEIKALFPFPPYSIQVDFATQLYQTIHSKKMGFFESPTGTVNYLSIPSSHSFLGEIIKSYCWSM